MVVHKKIIFYYRCFTKNIKVGGKIMKDIRIRDIEVITTAPAGINLVVVKVTTSEPELYGLGCATFTQRYLAVKTAVEEYLKPLLIGRDPLRIEDIWQSAMGSSYWRNGPVLNNALSGIDMALWDIKGKLANMPVYQLLGGKVREAAAVYRHADGDDKEELADNVAKYMEKGYKYIRCQSGGYGGKSTNIHKPQNSLPGSYFDPDKYMRNMIIAFDHIRDKFGFEIDILHDVHERLSPIKAVNFAKQLEDYQLFFLEDPLPPEHLEWFKMIRNQSATPIAMGELFNNPNEWKTLIKDQLIDFIRIHISQIGGLTPAIKLANFCDYFAVRTAWHGPGDVSPVGHVAQLHLDLSSSNFGIQEWCGLNEQIREVFPGCPVVKDGYLYPNDKPGFGIDIDMEKGKKYPCSNKLPEWTMTRISDGTPVRP